MGQVTIENLRTSGAGARTYLWDAEITGISGFTNINVRCTTVTQPAPTLNNIVTSVRGFDFKESGAVEWNDISFTVIENISYEFADAMWQWLIQSYDPMTGVAQENRASPTDSGEVTINLNDLNRAQAKQWTLNGCVLSGELGWGDLNEDKASMMNQTFNVSYAYAMLVNGRQ